MKKHLINNILSFERIRVLSLNSIILFFSYLLLVTAIGYFLYLNMVDKPNGISKFIREIQFSIALTFIPYCLIIFYHYSNFFYSGFSNHLFLTYKSHHW